MIGQCNKAPLNNRVRLAPPQAANRFHLYWKNRKSINRVRSPEKVICVEKVYSSHNRERFDGHSVGNYGLRNAEWIRCSIMVSAN